MSGPGDSLAAPTVTRPLRLTIIGSLPPPVGGATVLVRQLVTDLSCAEDVRLRVINTGGIRGAGLLWGVIRVGRVMAEIAASAFRTDVITAHLSTDPFASIALYIVLMGRIAAKPVVLRRFGGADYAKSFRPLKRILARFAIVHADLYLTETHGLVALAKQDKIKNVRWFSNSRPKAKMACSPRNSCRRFVFLGHVKRDKGVLHLIEAAERLPDGVSVDVYGPMLDVDCEGAFEGKLRTVYRGQISPEKVMATLMAYDALVLPTYYSGEGYPGVIIEAYMAGLPVICTRWQALEEIVGEDTGILVPPHDSEALYEAMRALVEQDGLYRRVSLGAAERAKDLDSQVWNKEFLSMCEELARGRLC